MVSTLEFPGFSHQQLTPADGDRHRLPDNRGAATDERPGSAIRSAFQAAPTS
jgi:hypothetical protein